tara:strand:+ start:6440 stop:6613 length:174 start_codon:yes stop_codon:yes gene_type:complete
MEIRVQYYDMTGDDVTIVHEINTPAEMGQFMFTLPAVAMEDQEFEFIIADDTQHDRN